MDTEEWREVHGYPGYFVSNFGNVIGKSGRLLKRQHSRRAGFYPFVNLMRNVNGKSKRKNANIHTLVANAFLGARPRGYVVHHKDGNRENSHVENLEYVTIAVNAKLRIATWLYR